MNIPPHKHQESTSTIKCFECKHLIEWPYCFAFLSGDGIPDKIRTGEFDHSQPHIGDNDIRFTPVGSPYELSESALKEILSKYKGQLIMPSLSGPKPRGKADKNEVPPQTEKSLPSISQPDRGRRNIQKDPPQMLTLYGDELISYAIKGDISAVKYLLNMGADADHKDSDGKTALMHACRNCNTEMVELLLEFGSDVFTKDKFGKNALDIAADWGYPSLVKLMKAHVKRMKTAQTTSGSVE